MILAGLTGGFAVGLVACSTPPVDDGAAHGETSSTRPVDAVILTAQQRESLFSRLTRLVPCAESTVFRDELTFYDDDTGVDCSLPDGEFAFVRVYRSSDSVAQTLEDWAPTLGTDRQIVFGQNWYVVGPPAFAARAKGFDGGRGPTQAVPQPKARTLNHNQITTCGRLLSSSVRAFLYEPKDYAEIQPELRRAIPGAEVMIRTSLPDQKRKTLAASDPEKVMAAITNELPELKSLCSGPRGATADRRER